MSEKFILPSYGKINWFLKIGEIRPDGYHDIESLMQKIAFGDEIEVALEERDHITCNFPIPTGEDGILGRLLIELRKIAPPLRKVGFNIKIKKNIPPGSGLGGGSSNIASILQLINSVFKLNLDWEEVKSIAVRIGSDVPFFARGAPFAWVRGRGEKVEPLFFVPQRFLVLLFPPFSISTAWAYQCWEERKGEFKKSKKVGMSLKEFLKVKNPELIEEIIWNDFEEVIFQNLPDLNSYRRLLLESGCKKVFMSGSGSTLVGVVENKEEGEKIVRKTSASNVKVILTSTWGAKEGGENYD
ncbi:MAG TPA: 4-(cytidine 5'-diphospho)-2-C-methyl-D-erythritol kinase [Candidatus Atribacteria bacterium]|nr:4-(cytidine 5'-diphospho)-2-C-methyl-D-erythritol kinase [Candidatus Atribacteria bacterium]